MFALLPFFAIGATAAVLPGVTGLTSCILSLTSSLDGVAVKQDSIGNLLIGGAPIAESMYMLTENTLIDAEQNICTVIPETSQLGCSESPSRSVNFTLSAATNNLEHDGDENWFACPASGGNSTFEIFTNAMADSTGCKSIQLVADGCASPVSSSAVPSATISNITIPIQRCPIGHVVEGGQFEFPHLIVTVDSSTPDVAPGWDYFAHITPDKTALYSFDIPPWPPYNDPNVTCNLVFTFPYNDELGPFIPKYNYSGTEAQVGSDGGVHFTQLDRPIDENTSFANMPAVKNDYGVVQLFPGNESTIATFPCEAGRWTYAATGDGFLDFSYFQAYASKPIGLYIVPC